MVRHRPDSRAVRPGRSCAFRSSPGSAKPIRSQGGSPAPDPTTCFPRPNPPEDPIAPSQTGPPLRPCAPVRRHLPPERPNGHDGRRTPGCASHAGGNPVPSPSETFNRPGTGPFRHNHSGPLSAFAMNCTRRLPVKWATTETPTGRGGYTCSFLALSMPGSPRPSAPTTTALPVSCDSTRTPTGTCSMSPHRLRVTHEPSSGRCPRAIPPRSPGLSDNVGPTDDIREVLARTTQAPIDQYRLIGNLPGINRVPRGGVGTACVCLWSPCPRPSHHRRRLPAPCAPPTAARLQTDRPATNWESTG